jgi:DHA2 family multidrug resistance protein
MTTAALTLDQDVWRPRYNPWLIAVVVALAAFMEVLDTSIANVALPYMAGNLGASNDHSTWVLTSYLVSNAIILPMTDGLPGRWGRKRFFMGCLAIFTISSLLCGFAPSLGFLLLFRVMQGAGGGGLQPMAQAILADTFPPEKRGLAFRRVRYHRNHGADDWPDSGWMDHVQLLLALDFLYQSSVGVMAWFLVRRFVEDPPYLQRLKAPESSWTMLALPF